ncbi:MAG: hypothetical protein IPN11_05560 [Opitutaceae bacterium]|nr:hypothetical protein [Opitutaceae bacterium]
MRTHSYTPSALLVALLLAPSAWSQTDPTEQAATTVQPASDVVIKDDAADAAGSATKGKDASGADTLSVDFPDEDIRNILRNVADLFELNLVVPETLQGRTSIKLRDVSWRQIFQVVLSPVNFTYIVEGNIIKVVSNESLLQEPATTEVFILNYARAADIKPTLDSLVDASKGGKLVVDGRSNALVITERPSQMNRIRPIIESLDKATDQVMIESKFVEVTNADIKNIGINWASLNGMQLTAGGLSQTFDRSRGQTRTDGSDCQGATHPVCWSSNSSTNRSQMARPASTSNGTTRRDHHRLGVATSTTQTNTGNLAQPFPTTDALRMVTTTYPGCADQFHQVTPSSSLPSARLRSPREPREHGWTNSALPTAAGEQFVKPPPRMVTNNVVSTCRANQYLEHQSHGLGGVLRLGFQRDPLRPEDHQRYQARFQPDRGHPQQLRGADQHRQGIPHPEVHLQCGARHV